MNDRTAVEIVTYDAAATQAAGAALGACLAGGQVVALRGDLGAGKTTFVQGLARGLGVRDRVASPTFILVNEYAAGDAAGGLRLVHIDTYRLGAAGSMAPGSAAAGEAAALGLEEFFDDPTAIVAIEWAERVAELLPADHLLVELRYGPEPDTRVLRFTAYGPQSAAALQCVRR